jgi:very-short-patch-repair endonuclease
VRQKRIEGLGVRFLRFADEEVKQNLEGVLKIIERWVRENGMRE